ncbi:hypothetical protein D3C81_1805300 [compost metagenome]
MLGYIYDTIGKRTPFLVFTAEQHRDVVIFSSGISPGICNRRIVDRIDGNGNRCNRGIDTTVVGFVCETVTTAVVGMRRIGEIGCRTAETSVLGL